MARPYQASEREEMTATALHNELMGLHVCHVLTVEDRRQEAVRLLRRLKGCPTDREVAMLEDAWQKACEVAL
jgi:hypothetical protein